MHLRTNFLYSLVHPTIRKYGTKLKPKVITDQEILREIDKELYKPRNHPGVMKPRIVQLPDEFLRAAENVLEDYPVKTLNEQSDSLFNHLKSKRAPVEKNELKKVATQTYEKVLARHQHMTAESEREKLKLQQTIRNKTNQILQKEVYNWNVVHYDAYNALLYLVARAAPEYAVLVKIFAEMAKRDAVFKPRSLFDFGSGIGTATWATNAYWKNSICEYYNVDSSVHMNDLAQLLLQDGRGEKQMSLKGVSYRQFLPASRMMYDLVVSAYSLLELPSRQARLETIINLWNKTYKYLVIVEQGSNAGFSIVNEVRDFILHMTDQKCAGHVFSPCPHDQICPRYVVSDATPCNFAVHYMTMPLGTVSERRQERYCYVVLKKGKRIDDPQWPRVVREALVRSKHTICRMCTKQGTLQEVIFTASKHGKTTYHCARSTRWGDLLPIDLQEHETQDETEENTMNNIENEAPEEKIKPPE